MIEKKIVETLVISIGEKVIEVTPEEAGKLYEDLADYFFISMEDSKPVAPPFEEDEEEDEDSN
jgi:hypothetical protein